MEFFTGNITKDLRFAGLISDTRYAYLTIRLTAKDEVLYQVNGSDAISLPHTAPAAEITRLYIELAAEIDEYLNKDADAIAKSRAAHPSKRWGG